MSVKQLVGYNPVEGVSAAEWWVVRASQHGAWPLGALSECTQCMCVRSGLVHAKGHYLAINWSFPVNMVSEGMIIGHRS